MIDYELNYARLIVENLQLKGILLQKDFDAAVERLKELEKSRSVDNSVNLDDRPDAEAIQVAQFGNT